MRPSFWAVGCEEAGLQLAGLINAGAIERQHPRPAAEVGVYRLVTAWNGWKRGCRIVVLGQHLEGTTRTGPGSRGYC